MGKTESLRSGVTSLGYNEGKKASGSYI